MGRSIEDARAEQVLNFIPLEQGRERVTDHPGAFLEHDQIGRGSGTGTLKGRDGQPHQGTQAGSGEQTFAEPQRFARVDQAARNHHRQQAAVAQAVQSSLKEVRGVGLAVGFVLQGVQAARTERWITDHQVVLEFAGVLLVPLEGHHANRRPWVQKRVDQRGIRVEFDRRELHAGGCRLEEYTRARRGLERQTAAKSQPLEDRPDGSGETRRGVVLVEHTERIAITSFAGRVRDRLGAARTAEGEQHRTLLGRKLTALELKPSGERDGGGVRSLAALGGGGLEWFGWQENLPFDWGVIGLDVGL